MNDFFDCAEVVPAYVSNVFQLATRLWLLDPQSDRTTVTIEVPVQMFAFAHHIDCESLIRISGLIHLCHAQDVGNE